MKKYILIFILVLIEGCSRFHGWEDVTIFDSVEGKPCVSRGTSEVCKYSTDVCKDWFRKRATIVEANAVEITSRTGRYFSCRTGYPLFKTIKKVVPKFTKERYKPGSNKVTGQAFLRQRGGQVVTCAGVQVIMYPNTKYFNYIFVP